MLELGLPFGRLASTKAKPAKYPAQREHSCFNWDWWSLCCGPVGQAASWDAGIPDQNAHWSSRSTWDPVPANMSRRLWMRAQAHTGDWDGNQLCCLHSTHCSSSFTILLTASGDSHHQRPMRKLSRQKLDMLS